MIIRDIEFLGSFETVKQCPEGNLPEYAFIGRSNVGKSSLINMLMGRKELARISSTPGKTQTINYFEVNKEWRIVDLPGYGYAKSSKTKRKKWKKMVDTFLLTRTNLFCIFSLIDSRHELQSIDLEFINWLGENSIPFTIVYTKVDKVKSDAVDGNIKAIREELLESWEELPVEFKTSAVSSLGREEILDFISDTNIK